MTKDLLALFVDCAYRRECNQKLTETQQKEKKLWFQKQKFNSKTLLNFFVDSISNRARQCSN